MRLPFLHPGPPSGDDHDGLSGGPCASTRLLVGGLLWFCLCLGLSLWLASREGGAVLVAEDGQPVLATGDWLRHRDRLDDLMRQTLSRVMPGCRLLTMPGFSEQEARHYRVEGDGAPLRLALALQERLCQEALRTGPDGERLLADDVPMPQLRWTDDGVLEADVDGRTCLVLHFPGWETMLATLSRPMPEPALVLVIDDMGQKLEPAEQLASLPFPVALALWPHAAARRPVQQVARDMGLDVLLHMPMEAMPRKNGTAPNPGPGALETDMDAYAMEHALDKALAQVPTALGFNNHMGSGFTGRRDACPVWPTGAACSCWTASPAATASWRPAWFARASSRPAAMFFWTIPRARTRCWPRWTRPPAWPASRASPSPSGIRTPRPCGLWSAGRTARAWPWCPCGATSGIWPSCGPDSSASRSDLSGSVWSASRLTAACGGDGE